MDEQLLLTEFNTPELELYSDLRPALDDILNKNGLPLDLIKFEKLKAYYSCTYNGNMLFQTHIGKKVKWIKVSLRFHSIIKENAVECDTMESFCRIDLESADRDSLKHILAEALDLLIDDCAGEFGCCSRYVQCSDAGHCIHPDPMTAVNCSYRVHLKHGRIFYGKNANVK